MLIRVLNNTGDTRHEFKEDDAAAMNEARRLFDELQREGHVIYKTIPQEGGGATGKLVKAFDPTISELIARPRVVGG